MKQLFALSIACTFIALKINAADVDPNEILKKTKKIYEEMSSFKADGDIVSSIDMNSRKMEIKTTCSILLAKPNLYKITWSQNTGMINQDGAVWNNGDGAYLFMGVTKSYSKFDKDEMALAGATGISAGAANTIPSLFRKSKSFLPSLKSCKYLKEEKINNEMCQVIQGDSPVGLITLWVSKSRSIILQIRKDMGNKNSAAKFDLDDKQIAEALKKMGQEATQENIKNMKARMKMAAEMTKSMKAVFTETYKNIVINEKYKKEDFTFIPPKEAQLKKNMFENILSGKKVSIDPKIKIPGNNKSPDKEIVELEEVVAKNPEDLDSRAKLIKKYQMKAFSSADVRKKRQTHILWIIKNHPDSNIAGTPFCSLNAILENEAYQQGKTLWLKQVETHSKNTKVLENASNYCLLHDRETAEKLLKKGKILFPENPEWPKKIARLYSLGAIFQPAEMQKKSAKKALKEMQDALALTKTDIDKFYLLSDLAKFAFAADDIKNAKKYSQDLLDSASDYQKNWNHGNAIHDGNIILGRIAVKSGNIEDAKQYLLKAGDTPGSPQLNSFGPSMSLAQELLDKGENETVLEYLELCKIFWKMNSGKLEKWSNLIQKGEKPNFQQNLVR